jgi:hypothetical protein
MDSILGILLVAAVFAGIVWGVSRLMSRSDRNPDGSGGPSTWGDGSSGW